MRSPDPLDVLPAGAAGDQEHQLQEQHRRHGHRPEAFLVRSPGPLDALAGNQEHLQPATRDPLLQEQHR
ncbi:hypothetical protein GPK29_22660 [Aeromonas hydrophila]|uniref:hypothetical protein n=1 Tax=Aeromonas hydrophila TaxID=644 RepID=UPI001C5ABDE6|nr:hypothetical protein [Aeromonas hydrophila]MBW3798999.1 hypothetical protein [Aeromonas hydrophila]MBW3803791.1 hypothetical protein [Aeromonas hydrophila]MBW3821745.1 hypothetical protein [Aeromonas hydrophila]